MALLIAACGCVCVCVRFEQLPHLRAAPTGNPVTPHCWPCHYCCGTSAFHAASATCASRAPCAVTGKLSLSMPGWRASGRGGSRGASTQFSRLRSSCTDGFLNSKRLEITCIRCQPGSALGVVQVETLIQDEFEQNMCESLLAGHTVWRCCRKIRRLHQPSVTAECLRSATRPLAR